MTLRATDRVRSRLEALSLAGLDITATAASVNQIVQQALPFRAACLAPVDPATELITGTVKYGGLTDAEDDQWAYWEYEAEEPWDFRAVVHRPGGVTTTHTETGGRPQDSTRHTEFFARTYGFTDELRAAARTGGATWAFLALFREGGDRAFTPAEQEFMAGVSPILARGLRAGLVAGAARAVSAAAGPAVLVVGADGEVRQASAAAQLRVDELGGPTLGAGPLPMPLLTLIGAARSWAAGRLPVTPRVRLRTVDGAWVVAHASPLVSLEGGPADVVLTIEEARPPEVVPLVVAAFGLTDRERAVVQLVLQGVSTAQIAASLHLSAYTVQDHLKAVFAKAGVRSRRELTARVFFDQYAPRMAAGASAGASGWFAGI